MGPRSLGTATRRERALRSLEVSSTRGLVDAVGFCQAHRSTARVFSSTRQTLLAACAAATLGGPVVELGVRHGVSTRLLARAAGGHVHAFDSFEGLPQAWHDKARGVFSTRGRGA
jgi:predicted O-methyltransferase YrrM